MWRRHMSRRSPKGIAGSACVSRATLCVFPRFPRKKGTQATKETKGTARKPRPRPEAPRLRFSNSLCLLCPLSLPRPPLETSAEEERDPSDQRDQSDGAETAPGIRAGPASSGLARCVFDISAGPAPPGMLFRFEAGDFSVFQADEYFPVGDGDSVEDGRRFEFGLVDFGSVVGRD